MSDHLAAPQPTRLANAQVHLPGFTPSGTPEPAHRHQVSAPFVHRPQPAVTHPIGHTLQVVKNTAGYEDIVFDGKKAQAQTVEEIVTKNGFVPQNLVHNEVAWFYNNLGIDDQYFRMESVETIAEHVTSLYGAKILAWSRHQKQLDINLEKESENNAVYIHSSTPGVSDPSTNFEARYRLLSLVFCLASQLKYRPSPGSMRSFWISLRRQAHSVWRPTDQRVT